eukprot:gene1417-1788_t
MSKKPKVIRFIVIGDRDTGKKSLLSTYFEDEEITIQEENSLFVNRKYSKKVYWNCLEYELVFEPYYIPDYRYYMYRNNISRFYRGAQGAIVVFDLSNLQSYENSFKWFQEYERYGPNDAPAIFIGNKSDKERKVSYEEALTKISELPVNSPLDLPYFETNTRTISDFPDILTQFVNEILTNQIVNEEDLEYDRISSSNNKNIKIILHKPKNGVIKSSGTPTISTKINTLRPTIDESNIFGQTVLKVIPLKSKIDKTTGEKVFITTKEYQDWIKKIHQELKVSTRNFDNLNSYFLCKNGYFSALKDKLVHDRSFEFTSISLRHFFSLNKDFHLFLQVYHSFTELFEVGKATSSNHSIFDYCCIGGNLEIIIFLKNQNFPYSPKAFYNSIKYGHLNIIQFLVEKMKFDLDSKPKPTGIIAFAKEKKISDQCDFRKIGLEMAKKYDHPEIVKYFSISFIEKVKTFFNK